METSKLEQWLAEFNAEIDEAFRFSYPVRDRELQQQAIRRLEKHLSKLDAERLRLREAEEADNANMFLGMCCYARSIVSLLGMWVAIRQDDANEAWDVLIDAQDSARAAMRAHRNCAAHMVTYPQHLEMLEDVLFPRQQFVSSSVVVKHSDCSLCDAPFYKCEHLAGFPYNGEFCVEIVREIQAVDHVALVDFPDDKRCRIIL